MTDDQGASRQAGGRSSMALGIIAACLLTAILSVVFWLCGQVILLAFTGILVAIFVRGVAVALKRLTRLPIGICLPMAVVILASLGVAIVIFLGRMVEAQAVQMVQSMPQAIDRVQNALGRSDIGRSLLAHTQGADPASYAQAAAQRLAHVLSMSLTVGSGVLVMMFLGLFLAFQPQLYRGGLLSLIPIRHRSRGGQVLDELSIELRWWMVGQGLVMVIVGVMLSVGMVMVHNKLALALALLAGLVTFVPYLGAFIATSIALLASVAQGSHVWMWTGGLYLVAYTLEGYCITPLVQRGTVELPPALTLVAQLLLGVMFGLLGLVLAAPLLVSILVLVKMLYVQDVLGDTVHLPGTDRNLSSG